MCAAGPRFNPLDHPIVYSVPPRITAESPWHEHAPFAMLVVELAAPRVLVTVGAGEGDAHCTLCHAVGTLSTRCWGLDPWHGEPGAHALARLRAVHDPLYGRFSTLVQAEPPVARARFPDGSIDLLHLGPEQAADLDAWLPKLTDRGVVLATGPEPVDPGRFSHVLDAGGLTVVAVGAMQRPALRALLEAPPDQLRSAVQLLAELGRARAEAAALREKVAVVDQSRGWRVIQAARAARVAVDGFWRQAAPHRHAAAALEDRAGVPYPERAASSGPSRSVEELERRIAANRVELEGARAAGLRGIAFYLPQFHPIPENDAWWGPGFTEWNNVVRARPRFDGHYQPHLPADLGFYDLRLPELRERQAELARAAGIHGFCYHHYWFGGRRLLDRPFREVLESGRPDFPFCISWANENWTRRWDGRSDDVLVEQSHSESDDLAFIRDLLPALRDPRYVRVGGRALLLVYRADLLPDAARTAERWRDEVAAAGAGELYLCAVQSFSFRDPRPIGFDAAVEFPPHGLEAPDLKDHVGYYEPHEGALVFDYAQAAEHLIARPEPDYTRFRCAAPSWDNTARRGAAAHLLHHASPQAYEYWLGSIAVQSLRRRATAERLVFINAWNEWAEGAHLEPDERWGNQLLEATGRVLRA